MRGRVSVVPLHVAIDGTSYDEGVDVTPTQVAAALRDHRQVTTSRPSPGAFLQAYEDLLERGIDEIVSVHLSAKSSATISSAEIAGQKVQYIVLDDASDVLAEPTAWLFGNEAHGLSAPLARAADHRVSIPIRGRAESLNLASAASICLYESARVQAR